MATEVSVVQARRHLSELVRAVTEDGKVVLITRRSSPVAQLLPVDSKEKWVLVRDNDANSISRAAQIAIENGKYDLAKDILSLQGA